MDELLKNLNARLKKWKPETAADVRNRLSETIVLSDQDVLDLMRSRAIEQEVLGMLDGSTAE